MLSSRHHLHLHHHHLLLHSHFPAPSLPPPPPLPLLRRASASSSSLSSPAPPLRAAGLRQPLSELPEPPPAADSGAGDDIGGGDGPIEISPPPSSYIFAVDNNPTPLQVSTSVLLTGAISVFLFRSLRRRAKRAKEQRVRSSGVAKAKDLKTEALESLRAMGTAPVAPNKPPSPVQALLGGLAAGAIALILYKFATTIEASLNRQAISDNFSVRQITITIRTIINGICYLATFVFGVNSIGLILYAVQLAFGSDDTTASSSPPDTNKDEGQLSAAAPGKNSTDALESRSNDNQESSDNAKNF